MRQVVHLEPSSLAILRLDAIAKSPAFSVPYPHIIASGVLAERDFSGLHHDFPAIEKPGFFPLKLLKRQGAFDALLKELEGPQIAQLLTEKLGIELRDKPRMITIRKWSAAKDGRIHNDGEAKICTALLYLNPTWDSEEGGAIRVLNGQTDFDDMAAETPPLYGHFFAFKRTNNSWHGHKPFTGERRVIQVTWLRSEEDLKRKEKRGGLTYFLKKLVPFRSGY